MSDETNSLADLLEAAGEDRAAGIVRAAAAAQLPSVAPAPEEEPVKEQPMTPEQAEGLYMLERLKAGTRYGNEAA